MSKNKKIFNICLFIFCSAVLYLHLKNQNKAESNSATQPKTISEAVENHSKIATDIDSEKPTSKNIEPTYDQSECYSRIYKEAILNCPNKECLLENFRKNNSWAAEWVEDGWLNDKAPLNPNQRTRTGQAFYALAQAGLLSGNKKVPLDKQGAILTFITMNIEDPTNSFPLLYLSEIYRQKGDLDKSKKYLQQAAADGMHYDSYTKELVREIFIHNRNNVNDAILAVEAWASAATPDSLAIQELVKNSPEYALPIAQQLMEDGLDLKDSHEAYWVPVEYAIGRVLYKNSGGQIDYPDSVELMKKAAIESFSLKSFDNCEDELNHFMNNLKNLR